MITVSLDAHFQENEYEKEIVSPSVSINEHETNVSEVGKLIGRCFKADTVEKCDEREDTFIYLNMNQWKSMNLKFSK